MFEDTVSSCIFALKFSGFSVHPTIFGSFNWSYSWVSNYAHALLDLRPCVLKFCKE